MEDETRRATALENASLILPSISGGAELWLGNRRVGESPELLQCLGVSSIVNCAAVQVTPSTDPSIDTLCLALHDGPQVDASSGNVSFSDGVGAKQFEAAAAFIASALADGRTVLVHCADGVSRSAAITIAFLLIRGDTLRSAFRRVLAARPVVAPNGGLVNALIDYEAVLRGGEGAVTMHRPLSVHQRGGYKFVEASANDAEKETRRSTTYFTVMPSLLVQPELISTEYKEQRDISRIRTGRLLQHWIRIYSYLQPSFPQRIGMRRLCHLFNAVERFTTENPRWSTLMLMPIPSGVWTTFPNVNHGTLKGLVGWVNGVVEVSPNRAPRLLFLQKKFAYAYGVSDLSNACVIVDETGRFHLPGLENVTDDDVMRVAREYSELRSLHLQDCSSITDTSLLEVARRCSNLQSLHLNMEGRGNNNITDASMLEVARGCSHLQTLDLGLCRSITDASVVEVARGCSNLQTLNLGGCSNITDASLREIGRGCANLHSLDLRGCGNITDASLLEVARGCSNLQTLNLWCCNNITGASLLEVGRRCSNLQSLNLFSCGNITDASLLEVARGCSNLQTLNLTHCKNITDASVSEVGRRCSNLQILILNECSNITDACKNVLRQLHPKLELEDEIASTEDEDY